MYKRSLFTSIMLTVLATSTATISSVSNQPTFDLEHSTNETTVFEGETAYLKCRVKNLGDRMISWMNKFNFHILTVGLYTYTTDERFSSRINRESTETEWTLVIKGVRKRDAGWYSCLTSTNPSIEHDAYLSVSVTEASILGSKELYIRSGESLNLTCIINRSQENVPYIFWYRDGTLINYDQRSQTKIEIRSLNNSFVASHLIVPVTSIHDSGNYSCHPTNAVPQYVQVYVIPSESSSILLATTNDYPENHDGADDGSEGYFSYFVDVVCYYTSLFCRE